MSQPLLHFQSHREGFRDLKAARRLAHWRRAPDRIAVVATRPPRQCGIATFTADLVRAVKAVGRNVQVTWAAITHSDAVERTGNEPGFWIVQGNPASYRAAAVQLNASPVDVVSLQHEFGLYGIWGDPFADHLEEFLKVLDKPLVTTFHTVLPDPTPSVLAAVRRLGERSARVLVMTEAARRLLTECYSLDPSRLLVVPHGVPVMDPRDGAITKRRLGLTGRTVISTFGLVDPHKGIQYMIEAMAVVRQALPDALYLVIGKTHPELVKRDGERYREHLLALAADLGLSEHVRFVDEYLTQERIAEYLLASDVYVTPYLDPNQVTSGTLAYALGAGKAIVSTPYTHAAEVLTHDRGLLVPFHSGGHLAAATLQILQDPALRQRLETSAYRYGRETTWPRIGATTLRVLRWAAKVRWSKPLCTPGIGRRLVASCGGRRPARLPTGRASYR